MKHASAPWIVGALMLIVVPVANHAAQEGARISPARGSTAPMVFDTVTKQKIRVVTVASGLMHPWSIAFLPDGHTMLVADRSGQLRVVRDGVLDPTPISGLPMSEPFKSVPTRPGMQGILPGPDRLNEVTLHPQFAQNHLVYLSYPKHGELGNTIAVARGRLEGMTLMDVRDILVADAWETSGNLGGKMIFGPDGTLYLTVGDRDRLCCIDHDDNSIRMLAQDLGNHVGKTLRIKDDGSVPADNPFVGRAGVKPEIFTYGHRNGYGLAFHPETGALWQAEIGPMGGDEINILLPGRNYGWPLVSMGRNYTGTFVSDQPWPRPGMENPRLFWVPSISPSGLTFYTGDKFPAWKGSLFVGALNAKQLQRISFNQPGQAEPRESLLTQLEVRVRDVRQGPDGNLYVATERQASGEDHDGTVLRIEPAQ
jgi:glucose/arabinose dehydrogenase